MKDPRKKGSLRQRARRLLRPILRPPPWRALPRELRALNVDALAEKIPGGLRDPGFARLVQRIDASPLHRDNTITLYAKGDDAFAAMEEAIAAAQEEILLESYILKDDATGRAFADLLEAAARKHVAVRVLADAFGSFQTRQMFWDRLAAAGVEVHLFHPLLRSLWYQPFRDHRKILAVDRRVGFTGGMNIAEEYGSSPAFRREPKSSRATWRDTHLRVVGPAVWEMAVVFSEGWERAGGMPFSIPPLEVARDAGGSRVLVLDSMPGRGHQETATILAAVLGAARRNVWITNAYFAPRSAALGVFERAASRGVDIRLLLPGISDAPVVRHAGHGCFRELLASDVRVFEYQPSVLHAKSLVADGHVSMVGSSNMDFRSFHFNAECNLLAFDDIVARTLEAQYVDDLAQSVEITEPGWSARPVLHRFGDGCARKLGVFL